MESMNLMFLIFAFLFFISIVATRLSAHLGMPLLLVFLGVGMLAGEEGIGGIQFSTFLAANMVGQLHFAQAWGGACQLGRVGNGFSFGGIRHLFL